MTIEGFRPTHDVPPAGSPTWAAPDASRQADNLIPGGSPVQVLEEATGWAHVRCSNGWECWIDARNLIARTHHVPATGLEARDQPDGNQPAVARLDPGLPVEVIGESAGWTRVRCTNGWECWVDGRQLVQGGQAGPSGAAQPRPAAGAGGFTPPWVVLVGAAMAVLAGFLPWFSGLGDTVSAWDLKFVDLVTFKDAGHVFVLPGESGGLTAGLVLLLVVLAAIPLLTKRQLPVAVNLLLAAIPTVTALAAVKLYTDFHDEAPVDLGIGLILCLVGGLVMVAGALMAANRN